MKRPWLALFLLAVVAILLFGGWYSVQIQFAEFAGHLVKERLLDKSSALSRFITDRIGDYDTVVIEESYAHVHWRTAIVDGWLRSSGTRYWFRVWVKGDSSKVWSIEKWESAGLPMETIY
ncbi:MAG: hypothetical protein HND43_07200 [Armatimonadetes bacterium]|nr:hypothetical protein [Armatimonadota bacterium]MCZ7580243.1 hypothetical protein [Fimbriimonadaceae bacterium]NOG39165.1 hypothetical protein [Armatimonadota bacterium]GIK32352.1 MAG: hypothetical protein BroJett009_13440 [Armatimonadota bacterium]